MSKTLVIILSETRAHELTFDSFKKNVIDELNADLCLCIGVKPDYDYENPFYKLAKYHFLYNETDDINFAKSVEYSYKETHKNEYEWFNGDSVKRKHYTEYLKLKHQIGSITDKEDQVKINNFLTSTYIHVFFLWFLQKNVRDTGLLNKYDRFLILRSDYMYTLPYPKMDKLNENYIWIPDSEDFNGICDRSVVLSAKYFEHYVDILENFYKRSNLYYATIESQFEWNMERILKMNLEMNNVFGVVRRFPYISYAVRNINGSTRWSVGRYSEEHGYYIKYDSEYEQAMKYKRMFENSNVSIDEFYKRMINV